MSVLLVDLEQTSGDAHGAARRLSDEVGEGAGKQLHGFDPTSSACLQRAGARQHVATALCSGRVEVVQIQVRFGG